MSMTESAIRRWFAEYVDVFEACGRGERDARSLLAYWGVPMLVATQDGPFPLPTEDQVLAAARQQIDRLRTAGYDRTDTLASTVTRLNARSALYQGEFRWQRADGSEIDRPTVTFLVTDGPDGPRISALVPHQP
jgi:hypothetical protein